MIKNGSQGRIPGIIMAVLSLLLGTACALMFSGRSICAEKIADPMMLLAVVVSFCGLSGCMRDVFDVHRFIAPVLAACAVILLLMVGGMLGCLKIMLAVVYAAGFLWWVYSAVWGKGKPDLTLMLAYLAAAFFLFWLYSSARLQHTDDFAHWGLAAKILRMKDRFPNVTDNCVRFQGYPLGATVWIYYFGRLLSVREGFFFAAQNLLSVILLTPLFLFVKGKKKIAVPCVLLFGTLMFFFDRNLGVLQVDWLLGHFFASLLMVIYYVRQEGRRMLLYALVMSLALALVKNSGLYFAAVGCVLCFIMMRKQGISWKKALMWTVVIMAACGVTFLIWNYHVKCAYPASGTTSSHSMTTKRLNSRIDEFSAGRSKGDVVQEATSIAFHIAGGLVMKWFQWNWTEMFAYGVVLAWIAFVLFVRRKDKTQARSLCRWLIGWVCMVAGWVAMLFFTYLLSMSRAEAEELASYERYINTVMIPFLIMLVIRFVEHVSDENVHLTGLGRVLTAVALIAFTGGMHLSYGFSLLYNSHERMFHGCSQRREALAVAVHSDEAADHEAYLYCSNTTKYSDAYTCVNSLRYDTLDNDVGTMYLSEKDNAWHYLSQPRFHPSDQVIDDPAAWVKEMEDNGTLILIDGDMLSAYEITSNTEHAILLTQYTDN